MSTPEARARLEIDRLLEAAGWDVQDRRALNLYAARGVAVREFPLTTGYADYLLFVDRKAIGAVEAKAEGTPLSGVEAQAVKYSAGLPATLTSDAYRGRAAALGGRRGRGSGRGDPQARRAPAAVDPQARLRGQARAAGPK